MKKRQLSGSTLLVCLVWHTTLLLSPMTIGFRRIHTKTSSIFGCITCHSFLLRHHWSVVNPPSLKRSSRTEARRKIPEIFSEPKDGLIDDQSWENRNSFAGASVEEIQQRLVEKGAKFQQCSIEDQPSMTRVQGCVSTVYVVATIVHRVEAGVKIKDRIKVYGNSDAILSRGLLSLLKDYLEQLTVDQVLELEPTNVADYLGVRPALSKGRNDGLANMLKIIQEQLRNDGDRDDISREKKLTEITDPSTTSSLGSDNKKPTVALLLSGGVDSSVAFRLLLEQGYNVTPFYLKIWLEDELAHLGECPWEDDVNTCRQVCDQVGIDLQIVGLQEEYHQRVMQHTLNEASLGRTPNPDILCNSRIKFGCFLEYLKIYRLNLITSLVVIMRK